VPGIAGCQAPGCLLNQLGASTWLTGWQGKEDQHMAKTNQSGKIWVLALIGIVVLVLVGGLVSLQPYGSPLN
jgi:hypothetical protein